MSGLLGPDGKPLSSKTSFTNKKADPPKTGEAFGQWAGRDLSFVTLPGGGVVQFDLSKLTVSDFRNMRDHYQVNSSLAVLSFMQHQSEWHIQCDDKRITELCTEQLTNVWTQLNRALAQSNWSGFSPNALNWENDVNNRTVVLDKIKDLVPEECHINWKLVDGWAPPDHIPPRFKVYDGIKQFGLNWPIPVENSLWYPILMENGDHYGRKLLRPAFTSWFFSLLVHLFANRYYERFGEPTPIARAPYDDEIDVGGDKPVRGADFMMTILQNLRSRSAVVLPNDTTNLGRMGDATKLHYDYDIEYLESQMRGADFERYLTRLDEEISLAMFTPILLMRTADVGSYNLGVGHMQMYLWMLNAMNDDRATYINKYILRPIKNYNFGVNAPDPKIIFRKLGNASSEVLQAILVALIQHDKAVPDLEQLGLMTGMTLKQVRQTAQPPAPPTDPNAPPADPNAPANAPGSAGGGGNANNREFTEVRSTGMDILNRVTPQVEKAFREHTFGPSTHLSMGYKRRLRAALFGEGIVGDLDKITDEFYGRMDNWLADVLPLGESEFSSPAAFMALFARVMTMEIERLETQHG